MKNKTFKRSIAIVLCLAILAAIGIGAYLTDSDVKKDVYTVGNVQAEIVSNGDMELDNVGALLPGTVHVYERAATNTGINDAYVFMSLTIPYEMVGVSDTDGTQIGERVRQLFIPGHADGFIGSEWKLVDVGYIGQYEIEDNGQYCGEHDQYSAVVGDTITYVYGFIGDNADGSLKALASGETTSNLVETMQLTNLYNASKITGEVSTKLYAIQSGNVNGGLTDVNGVWAVINKAISGEHNEASTLTYSINNTKTGDAVGYAPLKLVDENGNVVATSVANENGSGQFQNVPAGDYAIETAVGDLVLTGGSTGYGLRNKAASVTITGEDASVALGLETPVNTLVQGPVFNTHIPNNVTSIEFVAMPQTYSLADATVPADAVDVSEAADGSVMAWVEGDVFYVVAMDGGMIYTNPNSNYMFKDKFNLTYIGTDNLDTSGIYMGDRLFENCGALTNNIYDFDFSNMRSFSSAFSNCQWLTEYNIPEGTTAIDYCTFQDCSNLISITIPSSVKVIGDYAFQSTGLTEITIPEGVEAIYDGAFSFCNLTEVNISASVNKIGLGLGSPFRGNNNLIAINVDPENKNYTSVDGVLFTTDMKTLIAYPIGKTDAEYTVPSDVETINTMAFEWCMNLTSVTIPEGVKEICENAFFACNNLADINIASTVKTFGVQAFYGTQWLMDKQVAGEVVIVNGVWVDASAVAGEFVIPEGTTTIPDGAFVSNSLITSVYIPASVQSIGNSAFNCCWNLETVTFAENSQLKTIGDQAFASCQALTSINLPNSVETIGWCAFESCTNLTEIALPTSLTALNNGGEFYNTGITSVVIPNNIISVGISFNACRNLTQYIVAEDHPTLMAIDGVLFEKQYNTLISYPSGKTNTTYIVPEGVQNLAGNAFANNPYLEEIILPASVSNLGIYCFDSCSNLKTINYCGTQSQWNQNWFGTSWNDGVHAEFKVNTGYVFDGEMPTLPNQTPSKPDAGDTPDVGGETDPIEAALLEKYAGIYSLSDGGQYEGIFVYDAEYDVYTGFEEVNGSYECIGSYVSADEFPIDAIPDIYGIGTADPDTKIININN